MEAKKSPQADLENKRLSFVLIGLVVVLALVYVTLEWSKKDAPMYSSSTVLSIDDDTELIPITIRQEPPPKPPEVKPLTQQKVEIVDNKEDTGDGLFQSSEADPNAVIIPQPILVSKPIDLPVGDTIFYPFNVKRQPSFPGGDAAMKKFLGKNIKYPNICIENGIEGKVMVSFVVDKDGRLIDIEVIKSADKYLDAEAVRVVTAMPKWIPGQQLDKPVKVKCSIPITFRL